MSAGLAPPSAEDQLAFLARLQCLFAESDFTATYKFALLIALADLAVEQGADTGDGLLLTLTQIAERFIQLYWQQASPYATVAGQGSGVLIQNNGQQAAIITAIAAFRQQYAVSSQAQARTQPGYASLRRQVARTVSDKPLHHLQNFGGSTHAFLYQRHHDHNQIVLLPGVAYCLRRFYPLVQQLARTHWIAHIKRNKLNHPLIGESGDLESFLFESSRQTLQLMAAGLRKLDGDACFYCGKRMQQSDVDHYLPFSLYPRDLAHNFVLAHPRCNRSKSDTLAARPHLERWLDRLEHKGADLTELGYQAGMSVNIATCRQVAAWGYGNARAAGSHAWLAVAHYEPISDDYLALFDRGISVE